MEINRKRVAKRLASGLMAGALALGGLAISGSSPAGAVPVELDSDQRIGGENRYATSALVSQELEDLAGDTETVIIANGENFPDALAASSLTGASSPILLVTNDSVPSAVRDRLNRLSDTVLDVLVIGGESAVSAAVFAEIEEIMDESDVVRIAGDNRYSTAVAVAEEIGLDAGVIALVSGQNFPDAVTAGSWAAATGYPILLANGDGIPTETSAALETAIEEDDSTRVIILGGASAVSSGAEEALIELGFKPSNVTRVAGSDRYMTNLIWNVEHFDGEIDATAIGAPAVACCGLGLGKYLNDDDRLALQGHSVMFVSGENFADALTAAPLAADLGAHVVLVNPTSVGASALSLAAVGKSSAVVDNLLGVMASLSDGILDLETPADVAGTSFVDVTNDRRFMDDVWVVGGLSAVPSSVIDTVAATADSTVTCSITVSGANDDNTDGPTSAIIEFSDDLSRNSLTTGGTTLGELPYIIANDGDLLTEGRSDITAVMTLANALDLNGNGTPDAMRATFTERGEGDELVFNGWDAGDIDYIDGNGNLLTGAGLRNFEDCSATVARDRTAPTVSVRAVAGKTRAMIHFSEPLKADQATDVDAVMEESDGTAGGTETTCSAFTGSTQDYYCETTGTWDTVTDAWPGTTFEDVAGNFLAADADGKATKAVGEVTNPTISATMECRDIDTSGFIDLKWSGLADDVVTGDLDGEVQVPVTAGNLVLDAKSGLAHLSANDYTFTFEQQRGLLLPTVSVEGQDVTVTIDRFVHDATDIQEAINKSSIGDGGQTPLWSADATADPDGLIAAENMGVAFDTAGGQLQEETCLLTITTSSAMHFADVANETSFAAVDSAGEFSLRVGGNITTADCDTDTASGQVSTVFYCMIDGLQDSGTVRLDMFTQYMDDTANAGLRTTTFEIS